MTSFLDVLINSESDGKRELARAELRVAVAEELSLRMDQLKTSKARVASELGISRSAVSQALDGNRNMSLNTLADIAGALKLRVKFSFEAVDRTEPVAQPTRYRTEIRFIGNARPVDRTFSTHVQDFVNVVRPGAVAFVEDGKAAVRPLVVAGRSYIATTAVGQHRETTVTH